MHDVGNSCRQEGRHGIAYLPGYFNLCSGKPERIGKALEAGGFPVCDWPVSARVQVSPFFRLEELGSDGNRWFVPPEATEEVGAP